MTIKEEIKANLKAIEENEHYRDTMRINPCCRLRFESYKSEGKQISHVTLILSITPSTDKEYELESRTPALIIEEITSIIPRAYSEVGQEISKDVKNGHRW